MAESTAASCSASHPFALESPHNSFRDHTRLEDLGGISLVENINEALSLIDALILLKFSVGAQNHGLLPGIEGVCEEHANQETARQAPLVSRVVTIRLRVNASMNTHKLSYTISKKMEAAPTLFIGNVNEGLVE